MIASTLRTLYNRLVAWQARQVRWTPRRVKGWERAQGWGRRRYVFRMGVLAFGGWMFIVMTLYQYYRANGWFWTGITVDLGALVVINLILWPLAGWFFGRSQWDAMERAYAARIAGTAPGKT